VTTSVPDLPEQQDHALDIVERIEQVFASQDGIGIVGEGETTNAVLALFKVIRCSCRLAQPA
jgi:hypothetical protein